MHETTRTLVYSLIGTNWVMAGSVISELNAWEWLTGSSKSAHLIHLSIMWTIWKECNNRVFNGKENLFTNFKDRWFHFFVSYILEHNIHSLEDFGAIVDMLIDMYIFYT